MKADAPDESDLRRSRIWALWKALEAHDITAEVAESQPLMVIAGPRTLTIRCDHRASDSGNLWLYDADRADPIAQADAAHLHEAITWVKGRMEEGE